MPKGFLVVTLLAITFISLSCREPLQVKTLPEPYFIEKDGSLIVFQGERSCLLGDDAIDYEVYISLNKSFLVVETMLTSTIQIARVYKKEIGGCYVASKTSISKILWKEVSLKRGFLLEEVKHPRIKFLQWLGDSRVKLELSGELESGEFYESFEYDLSELF